MKTTLKKTGNSFGVILNKKLPGKSGLSDVSDIIIEAQDGVITISSAGLNDSIRFPLNQILRLRLFIGSISTPSSSFPAPQIVL